MGMVMLVPPKSKLMRAIENAQSVFNISIDARYTLTTDDQVFRLSHGEGHWAWRGHHRVALLTKNGDEWSLTMIAPEHLDLLEDHDAGTTP